MNAPGAPRGLGARQPMLVIDPRHPHDGPFDRAVSALPSLLGPGDLVVLNDAATLPASLRARTVDTSPVELRLVGQRDANHWDVIAMGGGDWRVDTDRRPAPPKVAVGEALTLDDASTATVVRIQDRRWTLRLQHHGDAFLRFVYRHGRPIQYSYAERPLRAADVQTPWASRPLAVEMPSAARPLSVQTLLEIQNSGAAVARLTHAAGISATGDRDLDRALPFAERYAIPEATARELAQARRVLAIGTSVVRALEGSAQSHGRVVAGSDVTDLVLRPGFVPRVVDGILSGVHEPGTSHYDVLSAFAPLPQLDRSAAYAKAAGYAIHEFGDSTLIWPGAAEVLRRYCAA